MFEIYALMWKTNKCAEIYFNTETKELKAYLTDPSAGFPKALFGISGQKKEVNDHDFRLFIKNRIVPKTRENIADVLKDFGLKSYDEWEIWKRLEGKTSKDQCSIVKIE